MDGHSTLEKKTQPAKTSSLIAQIIGAVWIAVWSAYKFIKMPSFDIADVIISGAGIAACFTPVYFNLIMDKIKDIKSA